MLIRATLFLVAYLLVVKAGLVYRDSVRASVIADDPAVRLASEEPMAKDNFFKAMASLKEGDPRRSRAISQLASVQLERLQLNDAERTYRLLAIESAPVKTVELQSNGASLHLAYALTLEGKLEDAKSIYLRLLNDNRKQLREGDPRIALDFNNLGLNAYLIAQSEERGDSRTKHLSEAVAYFKQALDSFKSQPTSLKSLQGISVVLANEYLALRDLNDISGAKTAMKEAKNIASGFRNVCSLP